MHTHTMILSTYTAAPSDDDDDDDDDDDIIGPLPPTSNVCSLYMYVHTLQYMYSYTLCYCIR